MHLIRKLLVDNRLWTSTSFYTGTSEGTTLTPKSLYPMDIFFLQNSDGVSCESCVIPGLRSVERTSTKGNSKRQMEMNSVGRWRKIKIMQKMVNGRPPPPPNPLFLLIKKIFTVQVIFLLKWEIEISYIDFVDCSQSLTHTGYCVVID